MLLASFVVLLSTWEFASWGTVWSCIFAAVAWSLIAVGWGVSFVEAGSVVVVLLVCVDIGFAVLSTFALIVFALISDVSLAVVFNWGVSIILFFSESALALFFEDCVVSFDCSEACAWWLPIPNSIVAPTITDVVLL